MGAQVGHPIVPAAIVAGRAVLGNRGQAHAHRIAAPGRLDRGNGFVGDLIAAVGEPDRAAGAGERLVRDPILQPGLHRPDMGDHTLADMARHPPFSRRCGGGDDECQAKGDGGVTKKRK